jgi:hypothetical protein
VITHTIRHAVGLLWKSDQPDAETSTYTGQLNIKTQETNIHGTSGIRTRDPETKWPQTYAFDKKNCKLNLNVVSVVRFQVLTAASMKFRVFWDVLPLVK